MGVGVEGQFLVKMVLPYVRTVPKWYLRTFNELELVLSFLSGHCSINYSADSSVTTVMPFTLDGALVTKVCNVVLGNLQEEKMQYLMLN